MASLPFLLKPPCAFQRRSNRARVNSINTSSGSGLLSMTLSLKPLDSLCEPLLICGFCFCFHGFNPGISQDISKLCIIGSYGYLYRVFWRKMRPEFAYYLHFHETRQFTRNATICFRAIFAFADQ